MLRKYKNRQLGPKSRYSEIQFSQNPLFAPSLMQEFDGVMAEREGLLEGTALAAAAATQQQTVDSKAVSANDERIADAAGENQVIYL